MIQLIKLKIMLFEAAKVRNFQLHVKIGPVV